MDWVARQMGGDGPLRSGFGPLRGGVGPLRGGVGPLRSSQLTTVFTTCAATRHCGTTAVQSSFLKPSRARREALLCYVMSLSFLTTEQWVPSVRSNDTRVMEQD